jgi:hypothetical protein
VVFGFVLLEMLFFFRSKSTNPARLKSSRRHCSAPLRYARNAIPLRSVHLAWRASSLFWMLGGKAMFARWKVVAAVAALAAVTSSTAFARYPCVPGYTYRHGVCQPIHRLGYRNPVTGAVSGEAAGAARGNAAAGPVGAVVGGALGTAGGAITGTGNMLTGH